MTNNKKLELKNFYLPIKLIQSVFNLVTKQFI